MGVDYPSDNDYLLDAVYGLDMTTLGNGFSIEDGNRALDMLSGDMANMHDDLAGLLSELVDQAGDARTENALFHAAGMAQRAGMWSDMNTGFDELAEGQQAIADRISDVDTTLVNVGEMVGAKLTEVGGRIDEHRQDTANAIGRLQGEVATAGTHIASALYRGSELLSASLTQGFAKLNAEEERRMAELRSDLRKATEMPRENQALEIYKVAVANYAIGDYAQATKELVEALKLKSNHVPSLILLGKIAMHKGKANFARSRFTRALLHSLQQKNAAGFELAIKELGGSYLQRNDSDRAGKLFGKAIIIARKIFPEMVGRLEWERFRITLPAFEEKNDNQMIGIKLHYISRKYPEGWEPLNNAKEFEKLRERYPYLHLTQTVKKAEEVCGNEAHSQEIQWFKEIEVFLKMKVPKIVKMSQEMIDVLDILLAQVVLVHDSVVRKGGRDLSILTASCKEVFGIVMKAYSELPENKPPESAIVKRARIVPEKKPERWSFTEGQLAAMSLEQYIAIMKKFPTPTVTPLRISHGARGIGQQDPNGQVVTNDFTRILRTRSYEAGSPVRRQESGNAIYIMVPEPSGENWQVRKDGERINIGAGILFLPKSTLVDERTGSKFVLDSEGLPRIDKNFHVKLWDITLGSSSNLHVWQNLAECAKKSLEASAQYSERAKQGIAIMKSVLDSDYTEFIADFEKQYTGGFISEEKRDIMRQFLIAVYDRWRNNFNYYVDGLSNDETWDNMNMVIERMQMVYKIGLMRSKRMVTAESYWREYFQNNPHMQPSKIVYYDGNIHKAWSELLTR